MNSQSNLTWNRLFRLMTVGLVVIASGAAHAQNATEGSLESILDQGTSAAELLSGVAAVRAGGEVTV